MCVLIAYLVIILALFAGADARNPVKPKIVDYPTDDGLLRGSTAFSLNGNEYIYFRAIPYALAPVGPLRFEDPIEYKERWVTEDYAALPYQRGCVAFDNFFRTNKGEKIIYMTSGEEDCLFINVHTRSINPKAPTKPVIFFIHGGAFSYGGPNHYDTSKIMDRDVVFVNFAYRVGIFGFLSTGDSVVPGNMGLKDQLAALKWVHKHIWRFGGDKTRISLQGIGAGAVSVHFMYLSPLTRGLFHNGYSYSGSALSPSAIFDDIPAKTKQIAKYVNCPTKSSQLMVNCLRLVDQYYLASVMNLTKVYYFNPTTVFGPVVDIASPRPYLPQTPKQLLMDGNFLDLPWVTGFTAENGLYPAAEFIYTEHQINYLIDKFNDFMPYILFYKKDCPVNVIQSVRDYSTRNDRAFNTSLLQLMTERLYSLPAFLSAAYMSQRTYSKTRVYKFMHSSDFTRSQWLNFYYSSDGWSVAHRDDVSYIYDPILSNFRKRPRDLEMAEELLNLATTYANYSNFPPTFQMWEPAQNNFSHYNYLEIAGPREYFMNQAVGAASEEFLDVIANLTKFC